MDEQSVADSMRQTAGRLKAWAEAIANLNPEVGSLVAKPMAREYKRILAEAEKLKTRLTA